MDKAILAHPFDGAFLQFLMGGHFTDRVPSHLGSGSRTHARHATALATLFSEVQIISANTFIKDYDTYRVGDEYINTDLNVVVHDRAVGLALMVARDCRRLADDAVVTEVLSNGLSPEERSDLLFRVVRQAITAANDDLVIVGDDTCRKVFQPVTQALCPELFPTNIARRFDSLEHDQ